MDEQFSFKEIEQGYIKATYPITIGDKTFQTGEVLVKFDSINILGLQSSNKTTIAHGGKANCARIVWEDLKELNLAFNQGVMNKEHFAMMLNSKIITIDSGDSEIITYSEELETNTEGNIVLKYAPISVQIYRKDTGARLTPISITDKTISLGVPFVDVLVYYNFSYISGARSVQVGKKLISGYVSFEGRTRFKDDETGTVQSAIIKIPKLKLISEFQMSLGTSANPINARFKAIGLPVENNGESYICEYIFLNNDLDADL